VTCDRCYQPLEVGEHGRFLCPLEPRRSNLGIINDELEGGARFFENMGPEPVYVESKSQWRREVAARQLVNVDKHDSAYYAKRRQMLDEKRRDLGLRRDEPLSL
jgi:hypothetical protein